MPPAPRKLRNRLTFSLPEQPRDTQSRNTREINLSLPVHEADLMSCSIVDERSLDRIEILSDFFPSTLRRSATFVEDDGRNISEVILLVRENANHVYFSHSS